VGQDSLPETKQFVAGVALVQVSEEIAAEEWRPYLARDRL